ncbi:MAG TPA: ABC transporter permease subunit [Balneolaceae bacterium]|nr:ABC transporter permease subunit [Balneolaceae bacterium]
MISKLKYPILGMIALLFVFPFGYIILLSLARHWSFPAVWPKQLTFANWKMIFSAQGGMIRSFVISVVISLSVAFFSTLTGFITSKFIAYSRYRRALMLFSYFPFILSPVVYAGCIYFFFVKIGLSGTIPGVMIAQLIIAYPYAVIIFSGFWSDRLRSMENLVTTLGGNKWQAYVKVLLPAARGMLLVCFFQTYLISWFEYGLTSIIGVGQVQTLTIKVFKYVNEANMYYAALAACLLILPPVILLYINKRFIFKTRH